MNQKLGSYTVLVSALAYVCGVLSFQGSVLLLIAALALQWEDEATVNTLQAISLNMVFYIGEVVTMWLSSGVLYIARMLPEGIGKLVSKLDIFAFTNSMLGNIEIIVFLYFSFKALKGGIVHIPFVSAFIQKVMRNIVLKEETDGAFERKITPEIVKEKEESTDSDSVSEGTQDIKEDISKVSNLSDKLSRNQEIKNDRTFNEMVSKEDRRYSEEKIKLSQVNKKPLIKKENKAEEYSDSLILGEKKPVNNSKIKFKKGVAEKSLYGGSKGDEQQLKSEEPQSWLETNEEKDRSQRLERPRSERTKMALRNKDSNNSSNTDSIEIEDDIIEFDDIQFDNGEDLLE